MSSITIAPSSSLSFQGTTNPQNTEQLSEKRVSEIVETLLRDKTSCALLKIRDSFEGILQLPPIEQQKLTDPLYPHEYLRKVEKILASFPEFEKIVSNQDKYFDTMAQEIKDIDLVQASSSFLPQNILELASKKPTPSEKAKYIRSWLEENKDQLQKITEISLKDKDLSSIPQEIKYFPKLQKLNLEKNKIKFIPPFIMSAVNELVDLNLSDNQIQEIPVSFHLNKLSVLKMDHNLLTDIPPQMSLSNLTLFSVDHNKIKSIPNSNWKNLSTFSAAHNQIGEIPLIENCPLKNLNLEGNQIKSMSNATNFTNLEMLNLAENRIRDIPHEIDSLKKIKELYLNNNNICHIVEEIGNLTHLKKLHLSYNKIATIPEVMNKLSTLVSFRVDNNKIKEVPECLRSLKNLEKPIVTLSDDDCKALPRAFENIISLPFFDSNRVNNVYYCQEYINNNTSVVEKEFREIFLENKKNFIATSNELKNCALVTSCKGLKIGCFFPNIFNELMEEKETTAEKAESIRNWYKENEKDLDLIDKKALRIESEEMKFFPAEFTDWFPNLEELIVHGKGKASLKEIPPSIVKFKKLKKLEFCGFPIQEIPDFIEKFENLEHLDLTESQIQTIPRWIRNLKKLRYLDLRANQIEDMFHGIENENLVSLNLCWNQIKKISIQYHPNLKELILAHNQITKLPCEKIGSSLPALHSLHLDDNKIPEYPEKISENLRLYNKCCYGDERHRF
jgi:Leucine-rich repeat (LRR) protein